MKKQKVIELVRDYGARQWSLIAKELKGRVGKQCRERFEERIRLNFTFLI